MVHQRIGIIVRQFLERGIITQEERGPFDNLVASTMRLRNSLLVELALLVFVFSAGPWLWRQTLASTYGVSPWCAVIVAGKTHMTAAGHWPLFDKYKPFKCCCDGGVAWQSTDCKQTVGTPSGQTGCPDLRQSKTFQIQQNHSRRRRRFFARAL
jgi:hypothetical protein